MKKYFLTLFAILCFVLNLNNVSASTNTFERSDSNYRVPSDIKITSENKYLILKTPSVDENEKVYDFANLLNDIEEENLYNNIKTFISDTNYDLVVVTINENNKGTAEKYADDFFDYNNFGINSSRDGVLILIDMDTRDVYISTSGNAIKTYDDSRIDSIIDAGFNELKETKYYECLKNMIDKLLSYYKNGTPDNNKDTVIKNNGSIGVIRRIPYENIVSISSRLSFIISIFMYFKTLLKVKKQNTVTYLNPNLSDLKRDSKFISTHTSKYVIHDDSSSSTSSDSSSHSGGSSFHSSSSGRSHGGGGRHF